MNAFINRIFNQCTLTLFRMGFFRAAHGWVNGGGGGGGAKRPRSLKSARISCNDETWHSYTLPKEDPKNISIT